MVRILLYLYRYLLFKLLVVYFLSNAFRFKNKICTKEITVVRPIDLNQMVVLREPCRVQSTKRFGCFCLKSDPINITFEVRKGGFVPGEKIICDVFIENQSSKRLNKIYVVLYQECVLHATSKTKTVNRTVCRIELPKNVESK